MCAARLEIQQIKIRQIVEDYRTGRLVVPEFQREYVWKPSRAPKLIDSIYRGYPVSVLLLWTGEGEIRARRKEPRPAHAQTVSWLIDGQQRVITLSRALNGDEGIDLVFNADDEEFRLANAATSRDPAWVRVSELLEESSYRSIRRALPEGARGERKEGRFDKLRAILDYEVPAVRMVDHSFDETVEAFTRINTLGVKLKREDIESAKVAARHSGFIAEEIVPFLQTLRRSGYSRLSIMHLFRACGFVAQKDGRSRLELHQLSPKDLVDSWSRTKRATDEALGLVRSELGLINMDILWSGALLVPVIALCATLAPRQRDNRAIAGWLAMASLLHRYSKSTESTLDQDLRACRADDPIGKLLSNIRSDEGSFHAVPSDFSGALNDKGALVGMYAACKQRGLKDLFSSASVLLQSNVERHHILPRAQFAEANRGSATPSQT